MTDQPCPCFEIEPTIQKPRFEPVLAYSGGFLNNQLKKKIQDVARNYFFDFYQVGFQVYGSKLLLSRDGFNIFISY